jgi:hypothetical protein
VDGDRIIAVVNRARRNPRMRAEAATAFARLLGHRPGRDAGVEPRMPAAPVAEQVRDNAGPPTPLVRPLTGGAGPARDGAAPGERSGGRVEPVRVAPGSLGSWYDDDEAVEA